MAGGVLAGSARVMAHIVQVGAQRVHVAGDFIAEIGAFAALGRRALALGRVAATGVHAAVALAMGRVCGFRRATLALAFPEMAADPLVRREVTRAVVAVTAAEHRHALAVRTALHVRIPLVLALQHAAARVALPTRSEHLDGDSLTHRDAPTLARGVTGAGVILIWQAISVTLFTTPSTSRLLR